MDTTTINAIIAVGGVIVGGLATALASAYSANNKVREIEIAYRQKVRDSYLSNARQYTDNLYVPLSILLVNVVNKYKEFRYEIDFDSESAEEPAKTLFFEACEEYTGKVDDLVNRGGTAFLTTELEDSLNSFNLFIKESIKSQATNCKVVLSFRSPFYSREIERFNNVSNWQNFGLLIRVLDAILPITFISISIREDELLSASVTTRLFEKKFIETTSKIKLLVKEVTLGDHKKN